MHNGSNTEKAAISVRAATVLFGIIAALGPALLAIEPETFGPSIWYSIAVVVTCAVVGGYIGRMIAFSALSRRPVRVAVLTFVFPLALYAAGVVAILIVVTLHNGLEEIFLSATQAAKGFLILFLYYLFSLYLPYTVASAVASWILYHRAGKPAA